MFSTYQRLGVHVRDSNRAVVRATRRKFRKAVRIDPACREGRKAIYRDMLHYHARAAKLFTSNRF